MQQNDMERMFDDIYHQTIPAILFSYHKDQVRFTDLLQSLFDAWYRSDKVSFQEIYDKLKEGLNNRKEGGSHKELLIKTFNDRFLSLEQRFKNITNFQVEFNKLSKKVDKINRELSKMKLNDNNQVNAIHSLNIRIVDLEKNSLEKVDENLCFPLRKITASNKTMANLEKKTKKNTIAFTHAKNKRIESIKDRKCPNKECNGYLSAKGSCHGIKRYTCTVCKKTFPKDGDEFFHCTYCKNVLVGFGKECICLVCSKKTKIISEVKRGKFYLKCPKCNNVWWYNGSRDVGEHIHCPNKECNKNFKLKEENIIEKGGNGEVLDRDEHTCFRPNNSLLYSSKRMQQML